MKRALVVDDEFAALEVLAMELAAEGLAVQIAGDGSAALTLLETQRFDLILCDLTMPVMGGVVLLETARTRGLLYDACFVLMCQRYERVTIQGVMRLNKPVRLHDLRNLIAQL